MPILATSAYPYSGLGAVSSNPALISSLAAAIKQQEGFYLGSRAYRNNNPGNLMDPYGTIFPQYPKDADHFVIFPDLATGEAALENDLTIKVNRGMTITSFLNMYAPAAAGNNTPVYIANVSAATGIDPNVPLNQVNSPGPSFPSATPDLSADAGGFDLSAIFGGDTGAPTPLTDTGVLSIGTLSTGAIVGLVIAGLALYFYFRD